MSPRPLHYRKTEPRILGIPRGRAAAQVLAHGAPPRGAAKAEQRSMILSHKAAGGLLALGLLLGPAMQAQSGREEKAQSGSPTVPAPESFRMRGMASAR